MRLAMATLVVPDYAPALAFYAAGLGFAVIADRPLAAPKRWVVVRPPGGGADLLLARAADAAQRRAIGAQTGGRVAFFLESRAFDADLARLEAAGARLLERPREEAYGRVVKWADPFGNRWDLIAPPADPSAEHQPVSPAP